jgi:nicotinate-nucleotide adenylyltransferase
MLDDLLSWRDPAGVVQQSDTLVAVHRPGYQLDSHYLTSLEAAVPGIKERLLPLEAPQMAISSSDLRQRVATHRPIRYQVPEAVEAYILAHGLYSQPIPAVSDQRHPQPRHTY